MSAVNTFFLTSALIVVLPREDFNTNINYRIQCVIAREQETGSSNVLICDQSRPLIRVLLFPSNDTILGAMNTYFQPTRNS